MSCGQRREQGNRAFLVGQRLAVLERQIDEQFLDSGQVLVPPIGERRFGQSACLRVAGEGLGFAAKEVARKLVEKDQQGEQALPVVSPGRQFAGQRRIHCRQEAAADLVVEPGILAEPGAAGLAVFRLALKAEPEGENVRRADDAHQPALPHESLSVTVRLKTGAPSCESTRSTVK